MCVYIYVYIYISIYTYVYVYIIYRMEEELDAETLMRGGVHFVCPICLEKKKHEESYTMFCCGQDICKTCADSYDDECKGNH
jgi:hypothetical protein